MKIRKQRDFSRTKPLGNGAADCDEVTAPPGTTPLSSAQANQLARTNVSQFQTNTFFTPFSNSGLTGANGNSVASNPAVKNQTLAEAIPALSFAVGRNFEGVFGAANKNNFDMSTQMEDGWPASRTNDHALLNNWLHGDAKDVAYPFAHKLWQQIVTSGLLK